MDGVEYLRPDVFGFHSHYLRVTTTLHSQLFVDDWNDWNDALPTNYFHSDIRHILETKNASTAVSLSCLHSWLSP